ncbi:MAG: gamma-glutamyl-gamma-aminobutyrate hydrolase family protein [Paracoccaceae bacterium]
MRPVIGIIGNAHIINDSYMVQGAGDMNMRAVAEVCEALPLIVPALPDTSEIASLMDACAGFLFPGGRPNVHPSHYGHEETEAHGAFDRNRDALALPLIQACVAAGKPILGICRGFQEFNVAFGGTLHPEIRDLPGRMNHRMPPDGTIEEKFALRHDVHLTPGGRFARIFGADRVRVNSLHGQGIEVAGSRVIIEGYADDETPEAIHIAGATGFALAVQWHPEWNAAHDSVSRPLFAAFGAALRP